MRGKRRNEGKHSDGCPEDLHHCFCGAPCWASSAAWPQSILQEWALHAGVHGHLSRYLGWGEKHECKSPFSLTIYFLACAFFLTQICFLGSWACWVTINSVLHVFYLPNSIHLLSLVSKTLGWVPHIIAHLSPQMELSWLEIISVSTSKRWHFRLGI